MKISNRSAIFIALSAIVCLSVVGMRVFAQSGSARADAFTLNFTDVKINKYKDDPDGFELALKKAPSAHYCLKHTKEKDNSSKVLNNTSGACNPPIASVDSDRSEIILVDDQASGSTSLNASVRGPSVTQTIGTSSAADMTTVLNAFN
jgi:hypothetical protein